MRFSLRLSRSFFAAVAVSALTLANAVAQTAPAPAAQSPAASPLEAFAWLAGCWEGKVNLRDFREEWLPLRGDVMVGASQTALQGKTVSFEYLRLEPRADGVHYVAAPSRKQETAFRLSGTKIEGADEIFTFENITADFPQRIVYRRGEQGWLYAQVEGKVNGAEQKVVYPMRRVDCQSGELIRK